MTMTVKKLHLDVTRPEPAVSMMRRLRDATRAEHDQIEQTPIMARIFADDFTLAEYRQLLTRLYGFYSMLEPALFNDLPVTVVPLFGHRRKNHLLLRDLQALGLSYEKIVRQPHCFKLPDVDSFEQRLGVMYVLEGSTMGGQLIRRQLLKQFAHKAEPALNFYDCYGDDAGREWRALRDFIDEWFVDGAPAEAAIVAAKATFVTLTDWLGSA